MSSVNTKRLLFVMMALELAIWGAWSPKLFPYMGMLGFSAGQQVLVGSSWGIASVLGIFFSNQFADRYFAAERFLAASHGIGALCLFGAVFATSFGAFFSCFLIFSLVYVSTHSVTNTIAFANLHEGTDFGLVRPGGTVGWIMASWPFVFLLETHSGSAEVRAIFLVAGAIALVLAVAFHPPTAPPNNHGEPC